MVDGIRSGLGFVGRTFFQGTLVLWDFTCCCCRFGLVALHVLTFSAAFDKY